MGPLGAKKVSLQHLHGNSQFEKKNIYHSDHIMTS